MNKQGLKPIGMQHKAKVIYSDEEDDDGDKDEESAVTKDSFADGEGLLEGDEAMPGAEHMQIETTQGDEDGDEVDKKLDAKKGKQT